jgi:hypothetical protein
VISRNEIVQAGSGKYGVEALFVPPGSHGEGLAVGAGSNGHRVVGWGSWDGFYDQGRTLSIPHKDCPACALTIPAAVLAELTAIIHEQAEVLATGMLGNLARHYLRPATNSGTNAPHPDLIVIADDDPAKWQSSMERVRSEGTVVALLGPHPVVSEFDFYSQVHARSLNLLPLAWYLPPSDPHGSFENWHEAAEKVSKALTGAEDSSGWAWLNRTNSHQTTNP